MTPKIPLTAVQAQPRTPKDANLHLRMTHEQAEKLRTIGAGSLVEGVRRLLALVDDE